MNKQFVTYEIALALRELGFNEECLAIYYKDDNPKRLLFSIEEKYSSNPEVAKHQSRDVIRNINFEKGWAIKAPLWQQAVEWLMNEKSIFIDLADEYDNKANQFWAIFIFGKFHIKNNIRTRECHYHYHGIPYLDYNEAKEHAVLKSIDIIKKKLKYEKA